MLHVREVALRLAVTIAPSGQTSDRDLLQGRDPLFREAAMVCIERGASTTVLQKALQIGYGRAARIADQLHLAGILGPADGAKEREVLIGAEQVDEYCR